MKTINVVAAIIISGNQVLATQRGYGDFEGGWEFPGGKVEENETPTEAIKREIMEELNLTINVGELLHTVEYDYPKFHLSMDCFVCNIVSGDMVLTEHMGTKWLTKDTLYSVDWLPADIELIPMIEKLLLY